MKEIKIYLSCLLVLLFFSCGPGKKIIEEKKEPHVVEIPSQKVICIVLKGIPGEPSGKAIGQLFKVFYSLKDNKIKIAAPKARWVGSLDNSAELTGYFAMQVSEGVSKIPEGSSVILTN